jgi:hypothetical protein
MRIYLDTCALQDLKKPEYSELLNQVPDGGAGNIFCFSEAHLFDLCRDPTDHKWKDMDFMESIVHDHCLYFDKRTRFKYRTPREYYDDFDWTPVIKANEILYDDPHIQLIRVFLRQIPLDLKSLIPAETLPEGFPPELLPIFNVATNMDDFMQAMLETTEDLSEEQRKFKALLQYLHKHSMLSHVYEHAGIEGFDGEKVTDKTKFRKSYVNYFNRQLQRNQYELFIDQYVGLELFGIVKGKPKKQKMMNLINDARHAFFSAHCDIVISTDADFLKKASFLNDVLDVPVLAVNLHETKILLDKLDALSTLTFNDMVGELSRDDAAKNIVDIVENEGEKTLIVGLNNIYFSYFDTGIHQITAEGRYFYFTKRLSHFSIGTLVKEIEYVTNRLVGDLGADSYNNHKFDASEISDEKWKGRTWRMTDFVFHLNYARTLNLACYPIEYVEEQGMSKNS